MRAVVLVLEGNNIRLVHLALGAIINPEQREKKKRENGAVSATRCRERDAAAESGGNARLMSLFGCTHLVSTSSLAKGFDASSSSCDRSKEKEDEKKEKKETS